MPSWKAVADAYTSDESHLLLTGDLFPPHYLATPNCSSNYPGTSGTLMPGSKGKLALVVSLALAGLLAAFLLIRTPEKPESLGTAPAKFIPAQTLRLVDSSGLEFAQLYVGADRSIALSIWDADRSPFVDYQYHPSLGTGPSLMIFGPRTDTQGKATSLFITFEPELSFLVDMPGRRADVESKGWSQMRNRSFTSALYEAAFPRKSEHTIENTLPTEDMRLLDRDGRTFAVLGLTQQGEPGFDLVDSRGKLLASFALSEPGYFPGGDQAKQWPNLWLFDSRGKMRIMVELGPEPEPILTIFEETDPKKAELGIYVLDPQTGQETAKTSVFSRKEGAIPWLKHKMFKPTLPIVLLDQRNNVVWKSPR